MLRRAEVRKIFEKNRGSYAQLARDLDVTYQAIQDVLAGRKTSARILAAATDRAEEINTATTDQGAPLCA